MHKGPLVLTAADAFVLKAVLTGEHEHEHVPDGRAAHQCCCLRAHPPMLVLQWLSQL